MTPEDWRRLQEKLQESGGDRFGGAFADVLKTSTNKILFWDHLKTPQAYAGRSWFRRRPDVELVVSILAVGRPSEAYAGYAYCRICGIQLGSKDLGGFGFVWPEKAEHYVVEHEVWTPDIDRFLEKVQASRVVVT